MRTRSSPLSRHGTDSPLRLPVVFGVAGLVLLSACGGAGKPASSPPSAGAPNAAAPNAAAPNAGAAKSPLSSNLPLEEQLGLANFGEAPPLQEALVIRDCMKAQGFEYVPVDPAAQKASSGGLTSAQKRKLYGYDISTRYGQPQAASPPDPNATIRAALSAPNQAAYDQALNGTVPSSNAGGGGGGGNGNGNGSFRTVGGCTRQAIRKVYGGAQVFDQLIARLSTEQKQVDNDQRVVLANQAWSQCMTAAGYHYAKPSKIKADLKKRLKVIVGNGHAAPGAPLPPGLPALQHLEMSISRADLACNAQVHLTAITNKVQAEYDATFRQQNSPLLGNVKIPAAKG